MIRVVTIQKGTRALLQDLVWSRSCCAIVLALFLSLPCEALLYQGKKVHLNSVPAAMMRLSTVSDICRHK